MNNIKLHEALHQHLLCLHSTPKHLLGVKEWRLNGKLHREDGPAVEYVSGHKEWYINGILHREDGPAVEMVDGAKRYYLNNRLHRKDGPAIERADGSKEWWLNGEWIYCKNNKEFLKIIKLMVFL